MTFQHPQNEPASPPPGWYPDPVTGVGLRWWDGTGWTDQTNTGPTGAGQLPGQFPGHTPGTGLRPAGEWLSASFKLVTGRAGHLFPLIVLLSVVPGIVVVITLYLAMRDVVLVAEPSFGAQTIESFSVEGLEFSRFAPMVVALLGSLVCSMILATAITLHVARAAADAPERWDESLQRSLRRWPRVLGVSILVALILGLAFVAVVVLIVVGVAAFWPSVLVLGPLGGAAVTWLGIRLSLATTAAALAPKGVGSIKHSLALTSARSWPLFGRFCLLGVIMMGLQFATSIATAPFAAAMGPANLEGSRIEALELLGGSLPLFAFQQLVGVLIGGVVTALISAGLVVLYSDLAGQQAD